MTSQELISVIGSNELAIFVAAWLKHNRNATKAYLELHPDVTYESARVLGSRLLTKVNIGNLLALYDLRISTLRVVYVHTLIILVLDV